MKRIVYSIACTLMVLCCCAWSNGADNDKDTRPANYAKSKRFKALMLWEPGAEIAHVQFDRQSMEFFHRLNYGGGYVLDTTTTLKGYTYVTS